MNTEEAKNKINDLLDQIAEKHKDDPKVFHFKELNMATLEQGMYNVEKHKTPCTEIKIGYDLHNEFLQNFPKFIGYIDKVDYEVFSELSHKINSIIEYGDIKFRNAKVTFVCKKGVYYMEDDEILFLSEHDHIFCRGVRE